MSKGSGRRPGTVPDGEWERIFGKKPENCPRCGGKGHVPGDCNWPLVKEEGRKDDHCR